MTVLFFGTSPFAVPALRAVHNSGHAVLGVVTQPDRPSGRGLEPHESAVSAIARELGIETHKPEKARAPEFVEWVRSTAPDTLVVAAYGQILSQVLLDAPEHGGINIHGSLLPRWRGAAPIQRAVQYGDTTTGVTIMRMDAGMDTGPILLQRETPIGPDETAGELFERLAEMGAEMILEALDRLPSLTPRPQDDALATKAPMIKPTEGRLDWTRPARELYNLFRALSPRPGVFFCYRGKHVKVLDVAPAEAGGEPGTVAAVGPDGIVLACGEAGLLLKTLQPEGKPRMAAAAFANGYGVKAGGSLTDGE